MIAMSKKKEKSNALVPIKAKELDLKFPDNKYLEKSEKERIEKGIIEGGIATPDGKCYIGIKEIPKVIVSDKKAAARVYNNAENKYKLEDSTTKYLGVPELQKEISRRLEEPRSTLEREKLAHSERCLETFRENESSRKSRAIGADRIAKSRTTIGSKKIKEEKIEHCELSGEKFNGNAEVHHIERVADEPSKALEHSNLIAVTDKIHDKIHNENAETPEELKEFIDNEGYNTPPNLENILKNKKKK